MKKDREGSLCLLHLCAVDGELPTASFAVINGNGDNCSFISRSGTVWCVHNGLLHGPSVPFTLRGSILTLMISQMRVTFCKA